MARLNHGSSTDEISRIASVCQASKLIAPSTAVIWEPEAALDRVRRIRMESGQVMADNGTWL